MAAEAGAEAIDAGDGDDAAGALGRHDARGVFHACEDGAKMHGEHGIELSQIRFRDRTKLRATAGVVHEAVEAAEARDSVLDHGFDFRFDGDVGAKEAGGGAESLGESLASLFAATGEDHSRALGDEDLGGVSADSTGRAGDDGNFSFEWEHGRGLRIGMRG